MMSPSLPASWRLQVTPFFGSAFIKAAESVKSVAAFAGTGHLSDPRAKQIPMDGPGVEGRPSAASGFAADLEHTATSIS
jgi:hypothetical protein